jgi:glycosyltransferase involved in cell wall biosynthesis
MRGGAIPAFLMRIGADRVVAMSESVRTGLLVHQPRLAGRTRVVIDGVDTERFVTLPSVRGARQQLALDPDMPVVAMAARIKHWKGQWLLVKSLASMGDAGHRVQLLLAGDVYPGDEAHLEELQQAIAKANAADRIHLPGFILDPTLVFAAADILAAPSTLPEPLGLAVIDALTAGVPVVASALGGHLETVRDEIDGLLVAPGDETALGQAIARLIDDDRLRLQLAEAARRDRGRFDWAKGHERLTAIYLEVLPIIPGFEPSEQSR